MSTDLLNQIKKYKNNLQGSAYSLFKGAMLCRVVGVTFDNRQEALKYVESTTPLKLERDRRNKFDFNAIKVKALINDTWLDLGFIPASMNKEISLTMDTGVPLQAKVWKKMGNEDYGYGVTITITRKL